MATPEPSIDLPATFMSSGKKGKKSKYYEDVHGIRNPNEHIEGIGEDCESSDPEAPPTAFRTNKEKKNKKRARTSRKAMDSTAVGSGDEMAIERDGEPTLNFDDFVHEVNEYAQPGADASSEVDPLFHEALQEHAADPAETAKGIEQADAFQDSINADRNEYRAPTAVMSVHDEPETSEQHVSSSGTISSHVVDSETPPTTPPRGDWKRLPVKAISMFRKVDLLNKDPGGSDAEASVDNEPVVEIVKTRKRGRPSKIDKLAERNAKKAKTQAENDAVKVPATRHSLRSRNVKDKPASTPARPRGRPAKTGKFTNSREEPASIPARARGRPSKKDKEDPVRLLSPMRAAKKAAKSAANTAAAGKGGSVTRTRSQELKALIGRSSLRSAAKNESLTNLKNGRDAWKKEKKSNKAKAAKTKHSNVAPSTIEISKSKSKYTVKIGTGIGRRRKRRGVCWTSKKNKKSKAAQDIGVNKEPMVQVVIENKDFDRSEFIVCG